MITTPATPQASTCDGSTWHSQKRTHTLSNGEVVWDISGNVQERIRGENSTDYGTSGVYISAITNTSYPTLGSINGDTRTAKGHFGSSGNYTNFTDSSSSRGGLGYARLSPSAGSITRGGYLATSLPGGVGIFSVSLSFSLSSISPTVGFRCVYNPPLNGS